jgi:predicted Na+-dependent transporter
MQLVPITTKVVSSNPAYGEVIQFGLLSVACVPGGGFGHVAVIISKSDIPLSVTMNLISIVAMLGKLLKNIYW